jgi:endonuclease-8
VPEGDTIFRLARALHRALAGRVVTRFESPVPALIRVVEDRPLVGRTLESAAARGKHLLLTFSDDLTLHTHLRMNGAWHLYRPGDRWRRPTHDMRVLIATPDRVAVGFGLPVAEWLTGRQIARHPQLRTLGPDLLGESFDTAAVVERMRAHPRTPVADVLLDQRVVAGIGNVFKSEILFLAGVDPFARITALAPAALSRVIDTARTLLRGGVLEQPSGLGARSRTTTRSLDPRESLWVYGRGGRPCRRCGASIEVRRTGPDARLTYWCPRCQP